MKMNEKAHRFVNIIQADREKATQSILTDLEDRGEDWGYVSAYLADDYAETARRILDLHRPSGGDATALEAATNLQPLNSHHMARLKTLAREFLYLTI